MTEQEKLAREWAEEYQNDWPRFAPGTRAAELVEKAKAAAEHILATTAPLTMADVEWDHERHRGLGAVDDAGQEWVVLQDDGGYINCVGLDLNPVGAPDHPEVLETLEDYANAPDGTIVSNGDVRIWVKASSNDWITVRTAHARLDCHMADIERHVLRWGEEA